MKHILLEYEVDENGVVADTFDRVDWKQRYSHLSNNIDRENLIDEFILSYLEFKNLGDIGFRDSLKKQLMLGAPESLDKYNPFLVWMDKYGNKHLSLAAIDNEDYNNLIMVHGKGVVLDEDLNGTSTLGTKSLIFTQDLFRYSPEDFLYLNQAFYYLDGTEKSTRMLQDIKSLNVDQVSEFKRELKFNEDISDLDNPEDIKYFFLFVNGSYSSTGLLRKVVDIKDGINYIDSTVSKQEKPGEKQNINQQDEEFKDRLEFIIKDLSDNEGKDASSARTIINLLLKNKSISSDTPDTQIRGIVLSALNAMNQGIKGY